MIYTEKRFISEIEGFEFPNGVLNKQLAGCGAIELKERCGIAEI
jgi:hypothetical protein